MRANIFLGAFWFLTLAAAAALRADDSADKSAEQNKTDAPKPVLVDARQTLGIQKCRCESAAAGGGSEVKNFGRWKIG